MKDRSWKIGLLPNFTWVKWMKCNDTDAQKISILKAKQATLFEILNSASWQMKLFKKINNKNKPFFHILGTSPPPLTTGRVHATLPTGAACGYWHCLLPFVFHLCEVMGSRVRQGTHSPIHSCEAKSNWYIPIEACTVYMLSKDHT